MKIREDDIYRVYDITGKKKKKERYGNYDKVRWKITSTVTSILKDALWMHIRATKQQ